MARKFTVTKAEVAAIQFAIERLGGLEYDRKLWAPLETLLAKVTAPVELQTRGPGLGLADVERALAGTTKYARWIAGNPSRYLLTLQQAQATTQQIREVGLWIDRQTWLRGRYTLGSLASKWGEWLAQAQADKSPVAASGWTGAPARLGG